MDGGPRCAVQDSLGKRMDGLRAGPVRDVSWGRNMKKTDNRQANMLLGGIGLLVLIVLALVIQFMGKNEKRIVNQNQQYLEDAAEQSVKNMNDLFESSIDAISMVSRLYGGKLDGPAFDYTRLQEIEEINVFDYIEYVDRDGISHTASGESEDCSDQTYYLEGMAGYTGVTYAPSYRAGPSLCFYAPLLYQGEVIGVFNGIFGQERLQRRMESRYFGETGCELLCLRDGTVAAFYGIESSSGNILEDAHRYWYGGEEALTKLEDALAGGAVYGYSYGTSSVGGNVYLAPLRYGDLALLQTFPPEAARRITRNANKDAIDLEVKLFVVFVTALFLSFLYYVSKSHRLIQQKEDYSAIVDSVKLLYRRFVVIDLEKDSYEYLREGDIETFGISPTGTYTEWLATFQKQYDEQSQKMREYMSREHLERTLNRKNMFIQLEYRLEDGRWEKISIIKLNLDEDWTTRVLIAVEDVTKLKHEDQVHREALEAAFRAAESANHAKSDFLSRMSHDIRTPMNGIIGLTAIMGAHLDDPERVQDCLSKIVLSSKHLLSLINEVLDMSKIESGKIALTENEFNLAVFVDELLGIIQPSVAQKNLNLSVQIQDITHEDVLGDNLRLQQVCVNLLSNAVKYTGEGGHIRISLSEMPQKHPTAAAYTLVVEDDGIGMSPDFLERLYTPFERAEDVRVSKTQGTGLGMTITRSIVQMMGGSIQVESEEGRGTRFTVQFPLKLQEVDTTHAADLEGLPVLVADDDRISCECACATLEDLGMEGEWVLSGREAVNAVIARRDRGAPFYAVILDWHMPEMDGIETAREIRREAGPDVPIIILSAFDWMEVEHEARQAGVNAFLGKPLFKSKLSNLFTSLRSGMKNHTQDEQLDPLAQLREVDFSGKRALLVEDNLLNQEIAKEILEMSGLEVDLAGDGREGLEMFGASTEGYYSMIFMDVQMPVMNGYEATSAIRMLPRRDAPRIPIVAMTANTFSEDIRAAKEAGMDHFIAKPLDFNRLNQILRELVQ